MAEMLEEQKTNVPQKILACITVQENSRRLIRQGAELAQQVGGELHILHVEKGTNIFPQVDSPKLLQDLFEYGSQLGAEVHVVCDDHVPERIVQFVKDMEITQLVLGESMRNTLQRLITKDISNILASETPEVDVLVLNREKRVNIKEQKEVFSS